ncbi:MAG: alpha-L-glutamate ligase-like protein [Alphaproteobacteria bacterium]|nr:alpha-L-glutamate ligase-like protein [Alphaproteobacteria bacterium]
MLSGLKRLRELGIMGINERNLRLIAKHNPRRLMPLVDDKVQTKELAQEAGIPTPELYEVIQAQFEVRRVIERLRERKRFVIKPAEGSQGNGIIVIDDRVKNGWRKANGQRLSEDDMAFRLSSILSGMYSLAGLPDRAIMEYRVELHPLFDQLAVNGVPDIRIVVFKGVPIMAMLRLPTFASDGRANLHQGGVGVGVDIVTGRTVQAMQFNRIITEHPDSTLHLTDIQIPYWEDILAVCAKCADMTGLGYLGVDMVLDKDKGPLLLELNGRPGLSVQIANGWGLRRRVGEVEKATDDLSSIEARLSYVKSHFKVLEPIAAPPA